MPAAGRATEAVATAAAGVTRSKTVVDHAVVPAGGLHCRHCGPGGCRVHGGHMAGCRDGLCVPHCPVRPSQYGYYHTQWRRWPGQGVVPTSAEQAATPVAPPASQVPTVDEESPPGIERPEADGANSDGSEPDAMRFMPDRSAEDDPLSSDPIPERRDPGAADDELPAAEPPVAPTPGEVPAAPGEDATDGGLFDQSAMPPPALEVPVESGAMRYPATVVSRSLAAGNSLWRPRTRGDQPAATSARGR